MKDQQLLLRAVAHLRDEHPALGDRLRLLIVGDGPLYPALTQMIEHLSLQDIVWLAGDRDDVPSLLQAMDVFVLPSLAEGLSNTVLEAMASGLPVIATAVGGNIELVEEGFNGSLVAVGDHEALSDAMVALLENDDGAGQTGRQCATARLPATLTGIVRWMPTCGVYDELLGRSAVTPLESTG